MYRSTIRRVRLTVANNRLSNTYNAGEWVVVEVDAKDGPVAITLPTADGSPGTVFDIQKIDRTSHVVHVRFNRGEGTNTTLESTGANRRFIASGTVYHDWSSATGYVLQSGLGISVARTGVSIRNADSLTDNALPHWDDANGQLQDSGLLVSAGTLETIGTNLNIAPGGGNLTLTGAVGVTLGLTVGTTIKCTNIGAGVDNSVVVLDGSGFLKTDEIDPKVWDGSLIDGGGAATYIPKFSDADTLASSQVLDTGSAIVVNYTAAISSARVTIFDDSNPQLTLAQAAGKYGSITVNAASSMLFNVATGSYQWQNAGDYYMDLTISGNGADFALFDGGLDKDVRITADSAIGVTYFKGSPMVIGSDTQLGSAQLTIVDGANPQMVLAFDGVDTASFQVDTNGYLAIVPSGSVTNVTGLLSTSGALRTGTTIEFGSSSYTLSRSAASLLFNNFTIINTNGGRVDAKKGGDSQLKCIDGDNTAWYLDLKADEGLGFNVITSTHNLVINNASGYIQLSPTSGKVFIDDNVSLAMGNTAVAPDVEMYWNASNFIIKGALPTVNPAVAGQWWSNGGVVTISAG